jgi:hypothetical protein
MFLCGQSLPLRLLRRMWPLALGVLLGLVCLLPGQPALAISSQQATVPTLVELRNTTYRHLDLPDGVVTLTDGRFTDAASGITVRMTNFYAIGDLNGDGVADAAVILATETGGSGTFISLVSAVRSEEELQPAGVILLGDRVRIEELSIANGVIRVEYLRQGPNDPMCCPTQATTAHYTLRRGLLVPQMERAFGLLLPVQEGALFGYVNTLGEMVIEPQFVLAGEFSEGLAAVSYDGTSTGYINPLGELVINPTFSYGGPFRNGMAIVGMPGVDANRPFLTAFIDREGNFIFGDTRFAVAEPFSEGLAAISYDGERYGYINLLGHHVIEPQFADAEPFREGLAPVQFGDSYGYIDRTGSFVIEPQFESAKPFHEGLAQIGLGGKIGYINHRGAVVIEPIYDYGGNFAEGRALIAQEGRLLYINEAGQVVIDLPNVDSADNFSEGFAAITMDGQYGYIDLQGQVIIPPQYDYAGAFQNGLAVVQTPDSWGLINNIGELVLEIPKYEHPTSPETELIAYTVPVPSEQRAGRCLFNSNVLGTSNSWRCTVDNQVFDPCLLAEDGETIVCGADPSSNTPGFRVELTHAMPEPEVSLFRTAPAAPLWELLLEDGSVCTLFTGASMQLEDTPVTYVCSDSEVLLGEIDQSGERWQVQKAAISNDAEGNFSAEVIKTVTVVRAWQPTAP